MYVSAVFPAACLSRASLFDLPAFPRGFLDTVREQSVHAPKALSQEA